jgi:hypothetical protein
MANRQWRDRLRQELDRQGLPSEYVSRLVEELCDHATDILKENSSMDAEQMEVECKDREQVAGDRLGSIEQLASFARSEFRCRTFAGRHPLVTFLVGPIVAILGTLAVICLTAFGGGWLIDWATGGSLFADEELGLPLSPLQMDIVQALSLMARFVPFALSAWLFVRLGHRAGRRWWSVAACGIVALVAILFTSVVNPATDHSRTTWMIGLRWNWKIGLDQMLQAVAPLALCVWASWQRSTIRSNAVAI